MSHPSTELLRNLIADVFAQVINAHRPDRADSFYRQDYLQHNPDVGQGLVGLKDFLVALNQAFPDLHGEIRFALAEGDRVMAQVDWTGTHRGSLFGLHATGKPVRFRSAETFRVQDGLVAEHWDVVDNVEMQLVLGLLRRPAAG
jgi:predicted ester cyclase